MKIRIDINATKIACQSLVFSLVLNICGLISSLFNMRPDLRFQWCLRIVKKILKVTTYDSFQENIQYGIRFLIQMTFVTSALICYLATIFDDASLKYEYRYICFGLLFGCLQVNCN